MKNLLLSGLASFCILGGAVHAATVRTEAQVLLSDLQNTDISCSTKTSDRCSIFGVVSTNSVQLDAFDTSLGTLTRATLSWGFGINGARILRGDNLAAPIGDFDARAGLQIGTSYNENVQDFSSTGREEGRGRVADSILTNSTTDEYSISRFGTVNFTASMQDPSLFERIANGDGIFTNWTFYLRMSAAVLSDFACDGSRLIGPDLNPCGATNRVQSLNGGAYSFQNFDIVGPDFWYVRMTYEYTVPPPPPPPSAVPLPASALLLMGGLFGLCGLRKGKRHAA